MLRGWRFQKAAKMGVPAYMVYPDATLKELARRTPHTREELLECGGIGPAKARKFGKDTLKIIGDYKGGSQELLG